MPGLVAFRFCVPSLAQQLLCLSPVAAREETGGVQDVIEAQGARHEPVCRFGAICRLCLVRTSKSGKIGTGGRFFCQAKLGFFSALCSQGSGKTIDQNCRAANGQSQKWFVQRRRKCEKNIAPQTDYVELTLRQKLNQERAEKKRARLRRDLLYPLLSLLPPVHFFIKTLHQ